MGGNQIIICLQISAEVLSSRHISQICHTNKIKWTVLWPLFKKMFIVQTIVTIKSLLYPHIFYNGNSNSSSHLTEAKGNKITAPGRNYPCCFTEELPLMVTFQWQQCHLITFCMCFEICWKVLFCIRVRFLQQLSQNSINTWKPSTLDRFFKNK